MAPRIAREMLSLGFPPNFSIISGDMAFHQRLLPIFDHTDTAAWIETWERFAALGAKTRHSRPRGTDGYDRGHPLYPGLPGLFA